VCGARLGATPRPNRRQNHDEGEEEEEEEDAGVGVVFTVIDSIHSSHPFLHPVHHLLHHHLFPRRLFFFFFYYFYYYFFASAIYVHNSIRTLDSGLRSPFHLDVRSGFSSALTPPVSLNILYKLTEADRQSVDSESTSQSIPPPWTSHPEVLRQRRITPHTRPHQTLDGYQTTQPENS